MIERRRDGRGRGKEKRERRIGRFDRGERKREKRKEVLKRARREGEETSVPLQNRGTRALAQKPAATTTPKPHVKA